MMSMPRPFVASPVSFLFAWLVRSLGFVLGTAALLPTAFALTPQESLARDELIKSAQAAHRSGAHGRSLELYQRAAALETTPSLLYWMVWEQQELGLLADAYAGGERCLKELARTPNVRNAGQIRQGCQSLVTQLKDRVGRVEVQVPEPVPEGLTVKLSGRELNRAMIGLPYVITPGNIMVEAEAPGHAPFRLEINVPEGKTVNVTVTMAPAASRAPAQAHGSCPDGQPPRPDGSCRQETCEMGMERMDDAGHCCWPGQTWNAVAQRCVGVARCPSGTQASGSTCVTTMALEGGAGPGAVQGAGSEGAGGTVAEHRTLKPVAIAVGSAGTAALITSGVIWLVSNGRFNDLQKQCDTGCNVGDRREKVDGIKRLDGWALGLAIGGAALVGTAAVLQWVVPSAPERQARLRIDPVTRTALLEGRF